MHRMTSSDEHTSPKSRELNAERALEGEWQEVLSTIDKTRPRHMAKQEEVETSNKFEPLSADDEECPVDTPSADEEDESESYRFRDLTLHDDDPAYVLGIPCSR